MIRSSASATTRVLAASAAAAILGLALAACAGSPAGARGNAQPRSPQMRKEALAPPPSPAVAGAPAPSRAPSPAPASRAADALFAEVEAAPQAQAKAKVDEGGGPGAEEYAAIAENAFKTAKEDAVSTFAVDVDTASYANVRRFLREGSLPPPDAVRIEELVNYFDYGWKEPAGGAPIAVSAESASCPWAPAHRLVAIGLRTKSVGAANLPPANLVFLIDSSGSMDDPAKLPLVKRAFGLLVETMRPQDRVSIVVYAGSAGLVLPPTSGADKAAILGALDGLGAGGATAGGEGIVLAYETALKNYRAGGNNRVILATDGDFNVGAANERELEKLITSYRNKGIFLSVLGFGAGNVKDSRMELLADKGNGNYGYIDSIGEARKLLVDQMGATLLTVAKDVKVQVEFDPAAVASWRLIGYENRLLAARDFADDTKDAGEMGAGHRVTALYEIEPAPQAAPAAALGALRVRYKKPNEDQSSLMEQPLAGSAAAWDQASADLRFAASVAAYGMLLRGSAHKGAADWKLVRELAAGAAAADPSGRRAEFLELVDRAAGLSKAGQ